MMLDDSYWMKAQWGARVETPAALADRFLRTVDAIRPLHPLLATWTWGDSQEVWETEGKGGSYPFAEIRTDMVRAVEGNMNTGGEAVPDPFYGYLMCRPIEPRRAARSTWRSARERGQLYPLQTTAI